MNEVLRRLTLSHSSRCVISDSGSGLEGIPSKLLPHGVRMMASSELGSWKIENFGLLRCARGHLRAMASAPSEANEILYELKLSLPGEVGIAIGLAVSFHLTLGWMGAAMLSALIGMPFLILYVLLVGGIIAVMLTVTSHYFNLAASEIRVAFRSAGMHEVTSGARLSQLRR